MAQRHRRLDGVQVHSAKGDVSGHRAIKEEDMGMVSCCRQPSEEEGRLEKERERERERCRYMSVYVRIATCATVMWSALDKREWCVVMYLWFFNGK